MVKDVPGHGRGMDDHRHLADPCNGRCAVLQGACYSPFFFSPPSGWRHNTRSRPALVPLICVEAARNPNPATRSVVLFPAAPRRCLLCQAVTSDSSTPVVQPPIVVQIFQFRIAMLVMDAWQYFVHRYMHQNKFFYKHIHSQRHATLSALSTTIHLRGYLWTL